MSNPITIGHIARAHGLKGDVAVVFYSDHPEQFAAGFQLGGTGGSLTIEWVRSGAGVAIVKFAGVDDRDGAELLKGVQLTMEESDLRTLEEGEFWPSQLQGLEVRDRSGTKRGVVRDVITGGAQDRLAIEVATGRVEVPFVDALVPTVDLEGGFVVVETVAGLLEPDD